MVLSINAGLAQDNNKNNDILNILKFDVPIDSNNIPININQYYFPIDMFKEYPIVKKTIEIEVGFIFKRKRKVLKFYHDTLAGKIKVDSFAIGNYSDELYLMKEPLLCNNKYNKECFRFTWLRSFDFPVVLRLEKVDTLVYLIEKVYNKNTNNIYKNDTIKLSMKDWVSFNNCLNEINYWEISTLTNELIFGCDGADWLLEGRLKNKYHVVSRWSPDKKRDYKFKNACVMLINMSNLDIEKKRIY